MKFKDYYQTLDLKKDDLPGRDQTGIPQTGQKASSRCQQKAMTQKKKFKEIGEAYEVLQDPKTGGL